MDSLTQTSLEALLLKATSCEFRNIDTAAVEAFCTLINKEKDGAHYGVKAIGYRLQSGVEREVLYTLDILDLCMSRCGSNFQSEVGKFRFLNEMIKLVSLKYLGSHTPLPVKQRVLQLMYLWTVDYPKETKIKEAYDMLRKQGVIREIPNPNISMEANISRRRQNRSIFQDEEKSKVLQKLLQSKDPEDIQAANWLIKSMVKEDEKRTELSIERISMVESVQNNLKVFHEMLDFYNPDATSAEELEIMKELNQSCRKMKPNIVKIASEFPRNDPVMSNILHGLTRAFNKYNTIIMEGQVPTLNEKDTSQSLLDFENDECPNTVVEGASNTHNFNLVHNPKSELDVLNDIFTASVPVSTEVLQPTTVAKTDNKAENDKEKVNDKMKVLEELDVLSEHFMKENLQFARKRSFTKNVEKIPMNLLSKQSDCKMNSTQLTNTVSESLNDLDLNYLIEKTKALAKSCSTTISTFPNQESNGDDCLVDISDEKMLESNQEPCEKPLMNLNQVEEAKVNGTSQTLSAPKEKNSQSEQKITDTSQTVVETSQKVSFEPSTQKTTSIIQNKDKPEIKLNDIFVSVDSIKPSGVPPINVLSEKNGISITLHYAKDKPKDYVHVYVITTVSKNELPLSNYLFQAVVPKGCKLKLQPPSSTDLPSFNPFLPPTAITQIMLIGNPDSVQISLKFIVSYVMDEDTFTEMGEVEELPVV